MKKKSILSILAISLATLLFMNGSFTHNVAASTLASNKLTVPTNIVNNISQPISLSEFNNLKEGESMSGENSEMYSLAREATGYHLANVKYTITKGKRVYIGLSVKGTEFIFGPYVSWGGTVHALFGTKSYKKGIYKEYKQYVTIKWSAKKLENATNRVIGTINETSNTSYTDLVFKEAIS